MTSLTVAELKIASPEETGKFSRLDRNSMRAEHTREAEPLGAPLVQRDIRHVSRKRYSANIPRTPKTVINSRLQKIDGLIEDVPSTT